MRSVFAFPTADVVGLTAVLSRLGPGDGAGWFSIFEGKIFVVLEDFSSIEEVLKRLSDDGWHDQDLEALRSVRTEISGCMVTVLVSGRIEGQAEMLSALRLLLASGGYGVDSFSDGIWSLTEIESGRSGETFRLQ